jgi:spermidine/putrescine-binding protein
VGVNEFWQGGTLSRRAFLRRAGLGVAAIGGVSMLAACGGGESGGGNGEAEDAETAAQAGTTASETAAPLDFPVPTAEEIANASGEVKVLGWPYYEAPENLPSGVTQSWGYLTANEDTLTKTSQPGEFDAVTIYQGEIDQLRKLDRIIPIDISLLSNWSQMATFFQDTEVIRRDGQVWAVPYKWGFAFTHYLEDELSSPPETFEALEDPALAGKIGLPDDPYAVISTFAFFAGFGDTANSLTQEQFDQTIALLNGFKSQVRTIHAYGEEAQLLDRGDIWVDLPAFSGGLVEAQKAGVKTGFTYLGAWSYVDCWMILGDAPNLAATYAMINQSLSPEAQIASTELSLANPVVDAAIDALPPELRYASADEVLERAPLLPGVTVEEGGEFVPFQEWLKAWEQFKSA